MSHRHQVQSKINDAGVLRQVLNSEGIKFSEQGPVFNLNGGALEGTSINTKTGQVQSGDFDHLNGASTASVDTLFHHLVTQYTAALHTSILTLQGGSIESRQTTTIDGKEAVILICREA